MMFRGLPGILVGILLCILLIAVSALAVQVDPPQEEDSKKQTEEEERTAKKFIDGICSTCHDSTLINETKVTKQEWLDIVKNMNGKGAGLSEQDVELLASYLARNYGPK